MCRGRHELPRHLERALILGNFARSEASVPGFGAKKFSLAVAKTGLEDDRKTALCVATSSKGKLFLLLSGVWSYVNESLLKAPNFNRIFNEPSSTSASPTIRALSSPGTQIHTHQTGKPDTGTNFEPTFAMPPKCRWLSPWSGGATSAWRSRMQSASASPAPAASPRSTPLAPGPSAAWPPSAAGRRSPGPASAPRPPRAYRSP